MKRNTTKRPAVWLRDYQVIEQRPELSVERLRKDRVGAQIFPFHRVGRDCFYTIAGVDGAIAATKVGGKQGAA